jgi:hypothetical protein
VEQIVHRLAESAIELFRYSGKRAILASQNLAGESNLFKRAQYRRSGWFRTHRRIFLDSGREIPAWIESRILATLQTPGNRNPHACDTTAHLLYVSLSRLTYFVHLRLKPAGKSA